MKIILCSAFLFFFSTQQAFSQELPIEPNASGAEALVLGGAGYLTGMGLIYGAAAGGKQLVGGQGNILVGASGGAIEAMGIFVNDLPFFTPRLKLSFGFGDVKRFEYENTYARGLDENLVIRQEMKGKGSFLNYNWSVISGRLSVFGSYAHTWLKFLDFKTQDGKVIPYNKSILHDIETNTLRLGVVGHIIEKTVPRGNELSAQLDMSSLSGRIAQTDVEIYGLKINGVYNFSHKISLAYTAQMQRTKTGKEGPTSVVVNGQCGGISDSDIRSQCDELQKNLTSFVSDSNHYGTALPIGGARGLRSYREFRFRAANTALSGLELRKDFDWKLPLQLAAFYEIGQASDDFKKLFDRSVSSYGLGFRAFAGDIPIRLEFSSGNEGEAVFLTIGKPW